MYVGDKSTSAAYRLDVFSNVVSDNLGESVNLWSHSESYCNQILWSSGQNLRFQHFFLLRGGLGWVWGVVAEAVAGGVCERGRRAGGSAATHQEAVSCGADDGGVA